MAKNTRLWTMNLEDCNDRGDMLLALAKGEQLYTLATNMNHKIPLVFESKYNAILYIHDRFPSSEWQETIQTISILENVCAPDASKIVAVMRPLVLTCPFCKKPFSETTHPPKYGSVICPHCGVLVRLNTPHQHL